MELTQEEILAYQKGCLHRSWGISPDVYPLCCGCLGELKNGEAYAHADCARKLERETRLRSEKNG